MFRNASEVRPTPEIVRVIARAGARREVRPGGLLASPRTSDARFDGAWRKCSILPMVLKIVRKSVAKIMGALAPFRWKEWNELNYWKKRKAAEGHLGNDHYGSRICWSLTGETCR
jgi:hypothetical protein